MIFHFPVIFVIWFASKELISKRAYILAFGLGLIADLIYGNGLGLLAASYLLVALLIYLYKLRFRISFATLLCFMVISQIVFYYARGLVG